MSGHDPKSDLERMLDRLLTKRWLFWLMVGVTVVLAAIVLVVPHASAASRPTTQAEVAA